MLKINVIIYLTFLAFNYVSVYSNENKFHVGKPSLLFINKNKNDEDYQVGRKSLFSYLEKRKTYMNKLSMFRGGSSPDNNKIIVLVSTSFGSNFLDKKKKFNLISSNSVLDLKEQIRTKFPGSPPVALQRLFFGIRLLNDTEPIGNITALSPIPLSLDMISGTSIYNKSMSITQALDAYVSTVVQLSYLGDKLKTSYSNSVISSNESEEMESLTYRQIYMSVNESLYDQYRDQIKEALEAEKDPETLGADTIAWRSKDKKEVSPLTAAIAKEFDLNGRGLRNFIYYSIILMIFALFGTNTASSCTALLSMIPALWISKLRQLRLISKIAIYCILPSIAKNDFILPLLPATWQTIAAESLKWSVGDDEHNIQVESKNNKNALEEEYISIDNDDEEEEESEISEEDSLE